MALGNHEFDDGIDGLIPFIKNTKPLPVLSCNIDATTEPELQNVLGKSTILTVGNEKIGIIGYTTPDTAFLVRNVSTLKFNDEIIAIKNQVNQLKNQGVKILIALGHSGYSKDLEIARNIPELDVVVGGHTNTFLYTGPNPSNEEALDPYPVVVNHTGNQKTLVVQAFAFGKYLGYLNVDFDDGGNVKSYSGNPILLGPDEPEGNKKYERKKK